MAWYTANRDRGRLDSKLMALPPQERYGLSAGAEALGVVPSTWYPSSLAHRLLDAICETVPGPARSRMVREATAYVTAKMIGGLYAVLFRMVATPERYASHIQRAWRQLHDTGERRVELVGPLQAESITRGWAGHHPLLCEVTSETTVQIFRHMGCSDVVGRRSACVSQGDPDCRVMLRWSGR